MSSLNLLFAFIAFAGLVLCYAASLPWQLWVLNSICLAVNIFLAIKQRGA